MLFDLRSIPSPELITSCNIVLLFQVQIIYLDEETAEFVVRATFDHPYPTTKIIWIPDSVSWSVIVCIQFCELFLCKVRLLMLGLRRFTMAEFIVKTDHPKETPLLLRLASWADDPRPSLCESARTNSHINYCSLSKFIPDG